LKGRERQRLERWCGRRLIGCWLLILCECGISRSCSSGFLFVAVYYLHNFVHGSKGMCCIIKVFSKAEGVVIVSEGGFLLLVSRGKPSTSLSNISLVKIGAGQLPLFCSPILHLQPDISVQLD
jgi:hypothetical protein